MEDADIAVVGTLDLLRRARENGLVPAPAAGACIEALAAASTFFRQNAFTAGVIEVPPLRFQALRDIALEVREALGADDLQKAAGRIYDWVDEAVGAVLQRLREDPPPTQLPLQSDFAQFGDSVSVRRRLNEISTAQDQIQLSAARVKQAVSEAEEAAEHVREVAGDVAEHELGSEYSKLAESERNSSWFWSGVVILSLLGSAGAAVYLLNSSAHFNGLGELGRLALTLPVLGLAVFAARSAGYHRDNYKWAKFTAVQLKTIRAYTDDLGEEARHEIRRGLGLKVFAGQPEPRADGGELGVSLPAQAVESATSLVKAVAEATRRT
jgi:hypothetical protein